MNVTRHLLRRLRHNPRHSSTAIDCPTVGKRNWIRYTDAFDRLETAAEAHDRTTAQIALPGGQTVVEGNEIPYQPWALKKKQENYANRQTADPENFCFLPGVPRITYMPFPFQIFQTPGWITIAYEYLHAVWNIYLNSPYPKGPIEFWMGDSRGHWDGDTLVVDVLHFNDRTWFDRAGNFHSEALHVIERYTAVSRDLINYEVTIEDPKVFTRPWKISMPLYRRAERNVQLLEFECHTYADDGVPN